MAEYTIVFYDEHASELSRYSFDIWEGNLVLTNKRAIGIAESMYAYLVFRDVEAIAAIWLSFGNECEEYLNSLIPLTNWELGGITMEYPHLGKKCITTSTKNYALGRILAPHLEQRPVKTETAYRLAY